MLTIKNVLLRYPCKRAIHNSRILLNAGNNAQHSSNQYPTFNKDNLALKYAYYYGRRGKYFGSFLFGVILGSVFTFWTVDESGRHHCGGYNHYNYAEYPAPTGVPFNNNGIMELKLQSLPIVKQLTPEVTHDDGDGYTITRSWPFNKVPNLENGFAISPMIFHNKNSSDDVAIIHIGDIPRGFSFGKRFNTANGKLDGVDAVINQALQRNVAEQYSISPEYIKTEHLNLGYSKGFGRKNDLIVVRSSAKEIDGKFVVNANVMNSYGKILMKSEGVYSVSTKPVTDDIVPEVKRGWFYNEIDRIFF